MRSLFVKLYVLYNKCIHPFLSRPWFMTVSLVFRKKKKEDCKSFFFSFSNFAHIFTKCIHLSFVRKRCRILILTIFKLLLIYSIFELSELINLIRLLIVYAILHGLTLSLDFNKCQNEFQSIHNHWHVNFYTLSMMLYLSTSFPD